MKIELTGKTALVTGASRGIGRAIAGALGAAGAHVLCAARTKSSVDELAKEIQGAGGSAEGVELDISADGVRAVVEGLVESHDGIDILVNNAGVTRDDLFLRMKQEQWDQVMDTNLSPLFPITQSVVKKMIRKRWGRIINISSIVGVSGNPGQANYSASKAAVIGFTKALALEIGSRNITVNAIAPGFIETSMTGEMTEEARKALEERIAARRLGQPEDIAHATVFLASEQASYITGTVVNVSGGLLT